MPCWLANLLLMELIFSDQPAFGEVMPWRSTAVISWEWEHVEFEEKKLIAS